MWKSLPGRNLVLAGRREIVQPSRRAQRCFASSRTVKNRKPSMAPGFANRSSISFAFR